MNDHPLQADGDAGEAAQPQMELPMLGTPLNPVESAWVFHHRPQAARPEDLANAMQQGE